MIKIKDYIFNENEIEYIKQELEGLIVCPKAINVELEAIENATFEDIEWNYTGYEKVQPDYENIIKKYEEENKRLKDKEYQAIGLLNICLSGRNYDLRDLCTIKNILKGEE